MKKDNKKALYESIMTAVAKEVKKALNESSKSYEEAEAKNAYRLLKNQNYKNKII